MMQGRKVLVGGLVAFAVVVAGMGGAWWAERSRAPARVAFPTPVPRREVEDPTVADFLGADACRECHRREYTAWRTSTHGQAGGAPGPETVIAPFDGAPIRFADAVVVPSVNSSGEYLFTVEQRDRPTRALRVDGVIGKGHMVGGGTQGYVSAFPDGTVRFLPFDYSRNDRLWFCNTSTRTDIGWVPITEEVRLADCGDWPPVRILGNLSRHVNCQECHGSQISVRFDPGDHGYQTTFTSLAVNCESCHGPGGEHVWLARSGRLRDGEEIAIRGLAGLDKDESLGICFQCHALKEALQPGYLPGKRFDEYYSLNASLIAERPLLPDGRVRRFAYQENHLYSACYLSGSMTCVDCHDPHAQGYRDIYGQPLGGRFSDGQCLGCHASKAGDPASHTHHRNSSSGSRCVACHMPYLQQPELGHVVRYARSDHTIAIPRPAFDDRIGVENACRSCHADVSVDTLEAYTEAWYGSLKPHHPLVAGMLEASDVADRARAAALLLRPGTEHAAAQVASLNQLIEGYLTPNMPRLAPAIVAALQALADHGDPDVEALALVALHLAQGERPEVRRFLADKLQSLGDRDAVVRRRWVIGMEFYGDGYWERGEIGNAIVLYHKALEVSPEHPRILLSLASAYGAVDDHAAAVAYSERALAADPEQPLALVNLGVALEDIGRVGEAIAAYRRAAALQPSEALAHFNLGNAYLRRNQLGDAIEAYRQAVRYDPSLAAAHFQLARSYVRVNALENALSAARDALQFDPRNGSARQMVAELERAVRGGRER